MREIAGRRGIAIAVAAGVVAVMVVVSGSFTSRQPRGNRPNILIIVTDDQRPDTLAVMPETRRRFAAQGVRFPYGFVTTPHCCPSRASILTGRYAHNHGVHVRVSERDTSPESAFQRSTLERYLQDAGYRTAIIGKYLNGWPMSRDPPYFDAWAVVRVPTGVSYYGGEVNLNGALREMHGYNTRYVAEHASSFIEDATEADRPWFAYVAFKAPHAPFTTELRYRDAAVPQFAGNPASREKDVADKPPFVRSLVALERERRVRGRPVTAREKALLVRARQLRTLMSVDDGVAAIFRTVERLGESRRTLAIFTSDNGLTWGEHRLVAHKDLPYTPSVTVPLLLRWPGHIRPGTVDRRLAANIDIAPTVLGAAGVRQPVNPPLDGRSLLSRERRRRLLLEFWRFGSFPAWASIRTRSYQYVEYFGGRRRPVFREYYDLRRDPWQLRNLLYQGSTERPNVRRLARTLAAMRRCRGSDCQ